MGAAARGDPLKERSATSAKECQRGFDMAHLRGFRFEVVGWGGAEARSAHKTQARKPAGILSAIGANVVELFLVEGTASPGA